MDPSAQRILVVFENANSRREIVASLDREARYCVEFDTTDRALEMAQSRPPDLMIVDLYHRHASGPTFCSAIRSTPGLGRVPILVVSDQTEEVDRILAFECGADDFLALPFFPRELAARVRALLRRSQLQPGKTRVSPSRSLSVDQGRMRAEIDGRRIDLTVKELQILAELLSPAGRVVRRRDLIERLWHPGAPIGGRAIDAHIKNIRRKLGRSRARLETVRGVGYRITERD